MSLIGAIYTMLGLIALLFQVFHFRRDQPYQKFIVAYLIFFLCHSIVAIGIVELTALKSNLVVFHFFNPVEYALLSFVYVEAFSSHRIKRLIKLSVPLVMVLAIVLSLFVQPIQFNNFYFIMIESVLMVIWSLLFIRETILLQQERYLQQYPMFWVTVGILFYFIGNLCVEALLNYLNGQSLDMARRAYRISFIFKYLLLLLFMLSSVSRKVFRKLGEQL